MTKYNPFESNTGLMASGFMVSGHSPAGTCSLVVNIMTRARPSPTEGILCAGSWAALSSSRDRGWARSILRGSTVAKFLTERESEREILFTCGQEDVNTRCVGAIRGT